MCPQFSTKVPEFQETLEPPEFLILFLLLSCGVQLESISRDGDLWSRSLGMGRNWILDVIPSPVIGKWKARTTKVTIHLLKRKRSEKKVNFFFPLQCFFLIPSLTCPLSQCLCTMLYYALTCTSEASSCGAGLWCSGSSVTFCVIWNK